LRDWWRAARKKGWMAPGQPWLLPGYRAQHMSARQLHRLVRPAAARRHHAICIIIITGWAQVSGLRGEVDTLERAHAGSRTIGTTSSTGPLGSISRSS
jgi:hypothetical protein